MKYFPFGRYVNLFTMLCSLLLLNACAATGSKENNIEEMVNARWAAVLSGDFAGAYEYLSPGYRSSVSSVNYQRAMLLQRVQWNSAEYMGSECSETTCSVGILLGYRVVGALPGVKAYEGTQEIQESWILIDDQWYFVPEL